MKRPVLARKARDKTKRAAAASMRVLSFGHPTYFPPISRRDQERKGQVREQDPSFGRILMNWKNKMKEHVVDAVKKQTKRNRKQNRRPDPAVVNGRRHYEREDRGQPEMDRHKTEAEMRRIDMEHLPPHYRRNDQR